MAGPNVPRRAADSCRIESYRFARDTPGAARLLKLLFNPNTTPDGPKILKTYPVKRLPQNDVGAGITDRQTCKNETFRAFKNVFACDPAGARCGG